MSVAAHALLAFDDSFVRELEGLYEPWQAAPAPAPRLLALNEQLAEELAVDVDSPLLQPAEKRLWGGVAPLGVLYGQPEA